jgi:hypothetical protein
MQERPHLNHLMAMYLALAMSLWGCALTPKPVTGEKNPGNQSESAFSVNRTGDATIITATYNDGSNQSAVQYTATTRRASKGATHLGWSHSADYGTTWIYGGRVTPNDQWPILWGDPGIANSVRDQRYVFIVSLAVPKSKLDLAPGGVIDGPANNYIGGACIARSTDAGKTFALWQCLQTTEADSTGDFYDGGNMASDADGRIYAGWVNVDRNTVHIWRAADENSQFTKLPNPFAGQLMSSHPRLRVNLDTKELYVMAMNYSGELLIASWNGSGWSPTWHTGMYAAAYPCLAGNGAPCVSSDTVLRTGPQFSFDIGSFGKGNDHIRMMFTRRSALNSRLYIAGAGCTLSPRQCYYIAEWGTGEGNAEKVESSFNPLVRAYRSADMAAQGEPSLWMGSHSTYSPRTGRVSFGMGGLGIYQDQNGQTHYIHLTIYSLSDRILCADLRGYWGDYDDLQSLGPVPGRQSIGFARTYTDSQLGCSYRWQYTSSQVHVGFTGN